MQIRVGIIRKSAAHEFFERIDFFIPHWLRGILPADDLRNARNFKHGQSTLPGELCKAIAGKERDLDSFLAIFPLADPHQRWEKPLNTLTCQSISNLLFMPRPSPERVPVWNFIGFGHGFALSLTVILKNLILFYAEALRQPRQVSPAEPASA
jgi:hypothetical protein